MSLQPLNFPTTCGPPSKYSWSIYLRKLKDEWESRINRQRVTKQIREMHPYWFAAFAESKVATKATIVESNEHVRDERFVLRFRLIY